MEAEREIRTSGAIHAMPAFGNSRLQCLIETYWIWAAVILVTLLLWFPRIRGPIDLRWDGGVYYLLGTSLATGHGYRIASEPGSPEAVQYPPLLPAFVALHARLLGATGWQTVAPWLRLSYLIISLMYAVAVASMARRYLSPGYALVASLLCLLYSDTIFFSDLLYAELPFALVTVVFVLCAQSSFSEHRWWLKEALLFILAVAGYLLRTAGVVLSIAWVLEGLIRRRWKLVAARFALSLLPVVAWQAHIARVQRSLEYVHPAYEYQRAAYQYNNVSYGDNARLLSPFHPERGLLPALGLVKRAFGNAPRMIGAVGETVGTKKRAWQRLFFDLQGRRPIVPVRLLVRGTILTLATLTFIGVLILVRRGAFVIVLILFAAVGLALTTPWREQFTRYLVPVASFLAIATVLALASIRNYLRRSNRPGTISFIVNCAPITLLVIVLVAQAFAVCKMFRERAGPTAKMLADPRASRLFVHDATWQNLEQAMQWIRGHSDQHAIIATSAPHLLYLITGRLAVIPPLERDVDRARRLLKTVPVSYVIVDQIQGLDMTRTYAGPAVQSAPKEWQPVFKAGRTLIYAATNQPSAQSPNAQ